MGGLLAMCTKERKQYVFKELRDTIKDLIILYGLEEVESKLGIIVFER